MAQHDRRLRERTSLDLHPTVVAALRGREVHDDHLAAHMLGRDRDVHYLCCPRHRQRRRQIDRLPPGGLFDRTVVIAGSNRHELCILRTDARPLLRLEEVSDLLDRRESPLLFATVRHLMQSRIIRDDPR